MPLKRCLLWLAAAVLAASVPVPPAQAPGEWLPATGRRPEAIGTPKEPRGEACWTPIQDRILVTGGSAQPTSEWWDPSSRTFQPGPRLVQPRQGHRAVVLGDGRVLLLGGTDQPSPLEVLEPGATAFRELPDSPRFSLGAEGLRLADGKVLLVDGATAKAWLWDGRRAPSAAGSLTHRRLLFRLTPLPDGKVLASGGLPVGKAGPPPLELWVPRRGQWRVLKAPVTLRARHQATPLPDGSVLLWGGHGQDARQAAGSLERIQPEADRGAREGQLHPGWGVVPGAAQGPSGAWTVQADGTTTVAVLPAEGLPSALQAPPAPAAWTLNRFQEATLTVLPSGTLVIGTALSGPNLERWDPRTRHSQPFGVLRPDAEGLGVLPDRRVLVLGPKVVDVLDLKTGQLQVLGWRDDLVGLLKRLKGPEAPGKAFAKWPKGEARQGHVLVPLDRNRVLVVGGTADGQGAGKDLLLWDGPRKRLQPAGSLETPRRFTGASGEGALRLPDGTVAIWGGVPGV